MHSELCKRLVADQLQEALDTEGLFSDRVVLEETGFPRFYVRFTGVAGQERLLRFDAQGYDTAPVQVEPVDPVTREGLPPASWMLRDGGAFPSHAMRGGQPFLCLAGTREYYTHEGHRPEVTGARWESMRDSFRLCHLIAALATRFDFGAWR
jgi:hypothetical protein